MQATPRALLTAAAIAAAAGAASAQSFHGLGNPRTGNDSFANAVAADGSVVVGSAYFPDGGSDGLGGFIAIRWTPGGGMEQLGLLDGGDNSAAYGVSADGSVISGSACEATCAYSQPFRWLAPNGPIEGLGYMPGSDYTIGYGISDDGSTIVGYGVDDLNYDVFPAVWREATGVLRMDRLPAGGPAYAHVASGDGSVIVGRAYASGDQQAVWWDAAGAIHPLGFLPDPGTELFSRGRGVTPDGSIIVGTAHGDNGLGGYAYQGFRWTQANGMQGLGVSGPGGDMPSTAAFDITADGSRIVGAWGGETGSGTGSRAAVWDAGQGWRDLADWLILDLGLTQVADWEVLTEALAVSDDGSVIVGWGINRVGWTEGFVAMVPPVCAADFNGDGDVNTLDVLAFLNAWNAREPRADFNNDGSINTLDVLAYLNAWNAGC